MLAELAQQLPMAARHRWPPDSAIPQPPEEPPSQLPPAPGPAPGTPPPPQQRQAALQAEREAEAALDRHQQARLEARRRTISILTAGGAPSPSFPP